MADAVSITTGQSLRLAATLSQVQDNVSKILQWKAQAIDPVTAPLNNGDNVPGTPLTKAEITALFGFLEDFDKFMTNQSVTAANRVVIGALADLYAEVSEQSTP